MFEKRKDRFSIRKFKVGVGSVFLGSFLFVAPQVYAEETANVNPTTENTAANLEKNEDLNFEEATLLTNNEEKTSETVEGDKTETEAKEAAPSNVEAGDEAKNVTPGTEEQTSEDNTTDVKTLEDSTAADATNKVPTTSDLPTESTVETPTVPTNTVDKEALTKLVNKADEVRNSQTYKLAEEAVQNLYNSAITGGQSLINNKDATQEQVNNSVSGINTYIDALKKSALNKTTDAKAKEAIEKESLQREKDKLKELIENDYKFKNSPAYQNAIEAVKELYDGAINLGKTALAKVNATETEVKNSIAGINQYISSLSISAAREAVIEAEKAAKAGKDKRTQVEPDGVTQKEKAEVDALDKVTNQKKAAATALVNNLPDGDSKKDFTKRLEQVKPVQIQATIKENEDQADETDKGTDQDSNNGSGKDTNKGTENDTGKAPEQNPDSDKKQDNEEGKTQDSDKGTENGTENGIEKDTDKDTGKESEKEPEQDKEQGKEEDSNKGTESDKEKDTEPKTDTEQGTKPNTGSDTDSDKKQDSDQGTEPKTDSDKKQDSEQGTKPKTEEESKKDSDAQSDAPDTDNKEAEEAAAKVAAEKAVAEAEKAANAARLKLFELGLNSAISSEDKTKLDELDNATNVSKKAAEELVNKLQDETFKKGLQERLANVNPVNAEVNDTNNNGIPDAVDDAVKTAEAAVKAAQAAVSEAQAKLKDAQSNGEVTQAEKDAVDKLNEKITAEKEKATDLVNKLPGYVNKDKLNKQLSEITTVNAEVTKKDNNVKPDAGVQPNGEDTKTKAAEAAAEKAVAEAEAAGQAAQAKKEAVEANHAVNQAEKNEVTRLNNDTVSKKKIAEYLVSDLPNGEKKAALEKRLAAVKTVEVEVNDENDNGKPDSQDRSEEEAIAEKAVVEAEAAAKVAEMKKADVLKDKVVTKAEKAEVDKLNKETEAKKAAAKQLVEKLSEGAKKEALFTRLADIKITSVEVNEQDNIVKPATPKAP
ncbi:FIVAR domain-containing protein, partial [Aerococcaceae bacterium zg-BR9]|uniref:GA-like domain-containing protein n=1 Tax=Aerococcaceae bacterium zg-1292 TaxID=2774330 RepID=UPI004063E7A9|nr:FIVAR domain-containing protein [Aerococcaceae bacterium zg-BR9]